jgi:hypothetical protein
MLRLGIEIERTNPAIPSQSQLRLRRLKRRRDAVTYVSGMDQCEMAPQAGFEPATLRLTGELLPRAVEGGPMFLGLSSVP